MPLSRLVTKTGLTLIAIGACVGVQLGAWAGWSTSDADQQSTEVGVLDMDLASAGSTLTQAFGTEGDPLAPGDSGCRVVKVVNDGTVDFADFRLWADTTGLIDPGYVDTNGGDVDGSDPADDGVAPFLAATTVAIDYQADTGGALNCASAGWSVSNAATALDDFDASNAAITLTVGDDGADDGADPDPGLFLAPNTRAGVRIVWLRVRYQVDDALARAAMGVYGDIDWHFVADQRAAIANA